MQAGAVDFCVRLHDPGAAYPFAAGVTMAVSLWVPPADVRRDTLVVCYPGGGYSRAYFDYTIPGREDYSTARSLAASGFPGFCGYRWGLGWNGDLCGNGVTHPVEAIAGKLVEAMIKTAKIPDKHGRHGPPPTTCRQTARPSCG